MRTPWSLPQEAARGWPTGEGAALVLPWLQRGAVEQPWAWAVLLLCLLRGVPSQGRLPQVTSTGRLRCPWPPPSRHQSDASTAGAEPGCSRPALAPRQRRALLCSTVNVSRGCHRRQGWVLAWGKEQSTARTWHPTADGVAKPLTTAPRVFWPSLGQELWFSGLVGYFSGWLLGQGEHALRTAGPGCLGTGCGLARARKGLRGQLCPTPYALPSRRSLLGSFVLLLFFCL